MATPTRLTDLEMARDLVIRALAACEPREVAALTRELRLVAAEIEQILKASPKKGSLNDELAKRRGVRVAAGSKKPASGQ